MAGYRLSLQPTKVAWIAAQVGRALIVGAFAAGLLLENVHYHDLEAREQRRLERPQVCPTPTTIAIRTTEDFPLEARPGLSEGRLRRPTTSKLGTLACPVEAPPRRPLGAESQILGRFEGIFPPILSRASVS